MSDGNVKRASRRAKSKCERPLRRTGLFRGEYREGEMRIGTKYVEYFALAKRTDFLSQTREACISAYKYYYTYYRTHIRRCERLRIVYTYKTELVSTKEQL